ncbi:DUF1697 domain-containing protein [Clostridium sp. UBA1652]|uniref:DUF1697 domain-containing protein n=1 Tax=Clostridium sp. UBA1652 TaxID=1946348 RepID=UPI0032E4F06C
MNYIALLRGINVGGKNIIKMAQLKAIFEDIGFQNVKTYIQSGNVLFSSDKSESVLINIIEEKIYTNVGFKVSVILRSEEELNKIIQNCPFSEKEILEVQGNSSSEVLYVAFLKQEPLEENIDKFSVYETGEDKYKIIGRDVYLLFHDSIRNSKLGNNLGKLDNSATTRNWKTINKISDLVNC